MKKQQKYRVTLKPKTMPISQEDLNLLAEWLENRQALQGPEQPEK
jgi:hypothetical protein